MSRNEILNEVRTFLSDSQRAKYNALGDFLRERCESVARDLGHNQVFRIYARKDKQPDQPLKSPVQIARKLARERKKRADIQVRDVTDIVAMTVVMQYPDQIPEFIDRLKAALDREHLTLKVEEKAKRGYYATHIDVYSKRADWRHIYCEIQVKTMLHDAWSAKMHDLNYKPGGAMDQRLDRMMSTLGNTLQSIEVQSETLRTLIHDRWQHDQVWRQIVRRTSLEQVTHWYSESHVPGGDADSIVKDMTADLAKLEPDIWAQDPSFLDELTRRVTDLCRSDLRRAWWLAAAIAGCSRRQSNFDFAIELIDEWIPEGIAMLSDGNADLHPAEIWFAPMACQALGACDTAIDLSETILEHAPGWPADEVACVKLNLAHFLMEAFYFAPASSAEDRQRQATRVHTLITDAAQELRNEDPSAFHDAEGLHKVVFGSDAATIRAGIDLIQRGRDEASDAIRDYANKTYELHARLAWRRLAEVENGQMPNI